MRVFSADQFPLIIDSDRPDGTIAMDNLLLKVPDFVIPRMGAVTPYRLLAVLRELERQGVHALNGADGVATAMDKFRTQQLLVREGIPTPRSLLISDLDDIERVEKELGYPLILKGITGSKGNGICLCEDRGRLDDYMELVGDSKEMKLIAQEFMTDSYGRDLRVFVIGGEVVACMKRQAKNGRYKANFCRGAIVTEEEVTERIEDLALRTTSALDLDIAGVDLLFDGDDYVVCEANSSPGFKGIESCCNISIPHKVFELVKRTVTSRPTTTVGMRVPKGQPRATTIK